MMEVSSVEIRLSGVSRVSFQEEALKLEGVTGVVEEEGADLDFRMQALENLKKDLVSLTLRSVVDTT